MYLMLQIKGEFHRQVEILFNLQQINLKMLIYFQQHVKLLSDCLSLYLNNLNLNSILDYYLNPNYLFLIQTVFNQLLKNLNLSHHKIHLKFLNLYLLHLYNMMLDYYLVIRHLNFTPLLCLLFLMELYLSLHQILINYLLLYLMKIKCFHSHLTLNLDCLFLYPNNLYLNPILNYCLNPNDLSLNQKEYSPLLKNLNLFHHKLHLKYQTVYYLHLYNMILVIHSNTKHLNLILMLLNIYLKVLSLLQLMISTINQ